MDIDTITRGDLSPYSVAIIESGDYSDTETFCGTGTLWFPENSRIAFPIDNTQRKELKCATWHIA